MAEETLILNLEVDQGSAERQLEKIEGILLDNKKAVQDLQAAYKKGTITQEEYVKENIRLQQNIKKEQDQKKVLIKTIETESNSRNALKNRVSQLTKEYDSLNLSTATGIKRADQLEKELAQLNAQLTKGDKSAGLFKNQIGNYPKVLQDAASNIRVAGVSVVDIGTKLTSLANPITAVVGLIGALGAAYANSTIGAKDLSFAQTQLSTAFSLASNRIAGLISSAKEGEGPVTGILNSILTFVDKAPAFVVPRTLLEYVGIDISEIQEESKEIALLTERLKDLEISRAFAAGDAKESERKAEIARRERDDEKKSLQDRLSAADKIQSLLESSGQRTSSPTV